MRIVQWIALALAVFAAPMARAQSAADYPAGPVRLLVPFAAGGPSDVVARIFSELLSARWGGKTVLIENRPGAGTILASAAVAKAPPDGLTLLIATNSLLINPAIAKSLPYDTAKDFAPVSMIAVQPVALVANKAFEGSTVADVVAEAKKQPTNYTSPGPRGVGDLAGQMLKQHAGIPAENFTHINYNGSAPALTDVIAGRVPLMFDIWHSARRYVESGELKLIASASAERLPGARRTSRPSQKAILASK
jgi:tripartite-type tricarboxylate transporter receptor subunit TctC